MKRERNLWVTEQKEITGKAPADFKDFYDRFKVETPSTGEDGEDGDKDDGGGKKGKKEKGKKEKKKKGKKGKAEKGGGEAEVIKIGPTEVVKKFEEQQEAYIENW